VGVGVEKRDSGSGTKALFAIGNWPLVIGMEERTRQGGSNVEGVEMVQMKKG